MFKNLLQKVPKSRMSAFVEKWIKQRLKQIILFVVRTDLIQKKTGLEKPVVNQKPIYMRKLLFNQPWLVQDIGFLILDDTKLLPQKAVYGGDCTN